MATLFQLTGKEKKNLFGFGAQDFERLGFYGD